MNLTIFLPKNNDKCDIFAYKISEIDYKKVSKFYRIGRNSENIEAKKHTKLDFEGNIFAIKFNFQAMLNCVIIDDESFAIEVLAIHIRNTASLNLLYSSTNPITACNYILENAENIDLLFLDIEMQKMSGIELIELIPKHIKTVFTTAYDQHALTAFQLGAIDYLMKPISYEKFLKSIKKVTASNLPASKKYYFFIHADKKLIKINITDVLHVEGCGNFLKIYCKEKKMHLSSNTFHQIEKYLTEPNFVRVNKSHIIAFSSISTVEGNTVRLLGYKNGKNQEVEIPIGITYKKHFLILIPKV